MTVPASHPVPSLEVLAQCEAVRLFVARVQDVKPDFALTSETAAAVAEICVRLDGLPLAIELAAARVRVLSPLALLRRLGTQLTLLTGGARNLPARQQTLRATIDWSYDLLTSEEQTLFARLGVFVGGCTLEAAETLCNREGTLDVLEGIESLATKSLVRQDDDGTSEPRVGMLGTIREYAREQLRARSEAEALQQAHAAYYLAVSLAAAAGLQSHDQARWLAQLDREEDNLHEALQWAIERGRMGDQAAGEQGLRLAGEALWMYWFQRGRVREGRRWLQALLDLGSQHTEPRAWSLMADALYAYCLHEPDGGSLDRALELFRELGHQRGLGLCLWVESIRTKEPARAEEAARQATAFLDAVDDRWGAAWAREFYALAIIRHDPGQAHALLEETLALRREVGEPLGLAVTLMSLALVRWKQGDVRQARALQVEGIHLHTAINAKINIVWGLEDMGLLLVEMCDYDQAQQVLRDAVRRLEDLGLIHMADRHVPPGHPRG